MPHPLTPFCTSNHSRDPRIYHAGRFTLRWSLGAPLVMGVVNVTPDSFSDGGRFDTLELALVHARQLINDGAHILDIGGESTRPGARAVDAAQEWARVGPLLTELVKWQVPLSVDTMKPEIMARALDLGVDIVNDVNGFQAPGAVDTLAQSNAGAVAMHMQGEPRTMQTHPHYDDVVADVVEFLRFRLHALEGQGIERKRLLIDPGFGFGKTLAHNAALFQAIDQLAPLGAGVLIGVSRKRMIGEITGQSDPSQRQAGSVAAALLAAQAGAAVLRVHDVRETCDALRVLKWAQGPAGGEST